jgi:hypothetical protein
MSTFLSEPDADMIMVEGISQLCNDLMVRSIYVLILISNLYYSLLFPPDMYNACSI